MEMFMLNTGFYNIVTSTEGKRYIENKASREQLREEVIQHLRAKGIDIEEIKREQESKRI